MGVALQRGLRLLLERERMLLLHRRNRGRLVDGARSAAEAPGSVAAQAEGDGTSLSAPHRQQHARTHSTRQRGAVAARGPPVEESGERV